MPMIQAGDGTVTHINVFTVSPERQDELVRSLTETITEAKRVKGWRSASIHRSHDGTRVINYVQFESSAAAQAVTRHLLARGLIQRNVAIGSVAAGSYDVVYTLEADTL